MSDPLARVRDEWGRRVVAEYTSAALTSALVCWLVEIGASVDLVRMAHRIVADELEHAELSLAAARAAGGAEPPVVDRRRLRYAPSAGSPVELDVLRVAVETFCLGETLAVPLFRAMARDATAPEARAALERILRDEARHRAFGWLLLEVLLDGPGGDVLRARARAALPAQLAAIRDAYLAPAPDPTPTERAWGLIGPPAYRDALDRTAARWWAPRFRALGLAG